jgi:monoamine oxidase
MLAAAAISRPSLLQAAETVPLREGKSMSQTNPNSPLKVIIIGAGLAGLASAYQLSLKGHEVVVLEAQNRIGGRVLTLKTKFSDGLFAEAGAFFVSDQHKLLNDYLKAVKSETFKLNLAPLLPPGTHAQPVPSLYYLQGLEHPHLDIDMKRGLGDLTGPLTGDPWPPRLGLTDDETKLGLYRFMGAYFFLSNPSELGNPADSAWPPAQLAQYDKMTFHQFMKSRGASDGAIRLLRPWLAPFVDDYDKISALAVLREAAIARTFHIRERQWFTVQDGMDTFPQALAAKVPAKSIRLNSPVVEIRQEAKKVTVTYSNNGVPTSEAGDHLICAIPFSTLRHIKVSPPFSPDKQKAIAELPNAKIARVYIQCKERIWEQVWDRKPWTREQWKGMIFTDSIGGFLDSTFQQTGRTSGIVHAYTSGDQADAIKSMKESERAEFVVEQMDKIYPGLKKSYELGGRHHDSKCWDEDEWAQGAYAYFKPGQMFELMPHIATPEWQGEPVQRVHFAGDHTSAMPGWMEGALESGHRAAREIDPSVPSRI